MKEISGYCGYYATSDGRIYSDRTGTLREIAQRVHKGYMHVFIKRGVGKKTQVKMPVHQLVLFAYSGPKPFEEAVCRHIDGNPFNNNITNLRWGTTQENAQDSIRHGTAACLRLGERHPCTKLTEAQVIEIELEAKAGLKQAYIAHRFNINQKHVSDIKLHRTWKHLWNG